MLTKKIKKFILIFLIIILCVFFFVSFFFNFEMKEKIIGIETDDYFLECNLFIEIKNVYRLGNREVVIKGFVTLENNSDKPISLGYQDLRDSLKIYFYENLSSQVFFEGDFLHSRNSRMSLSTENGKMSAKANEVMISKKSLVKEEFLVSTPSNFIELSELYIKFIFKTQNGTIKTKKIRLLLPSNQNA